MEPGLPFLDTGAPQCPLSEESRGSTRGGGWKPRPLDPKPPLGLPKAPWAPLLLMTGQGPLGQGTDLMAISPSPLKWLDGDPGPIAQLTGLFISGVRGVR